MTVEMEQPFVWPEVPDLEPWGQKEKQEEVAEATRVNGGIDHNDQRNAARKLRDQVKKLLYKDVARPSQASAEDAEAQEARESEERMLKRMSRIKLWERERPVKTVESDNRKNYAIKV